MARAFYEKTMIAVAASIGWYFAIGWSPWPCDSALFVPTRVRPLELEHVACLVVSTT